MTIALLASSTPDADFFFKLLASVFFALQGAKLVKDIFFSRSPKHNELATKAEVQQALQGKADQASVERLEKQIQNLDDDLEDSEHRILEKMDKMSQGIITEVKKIATGAYQGREKLWKQVNQNRERIARQEGSK